MSDDKLLGFVRPAALLTWLVGAGACALCFFWFRSFFPPPSNDIFIASFFLLATVLLVGFFGIGHFVCTRIFRIAGSVMELPVGVGVLAIFLAFYLRLSINPLAPLSLIFLGCLYSLRLALHSRRALLKELFASTTPILLTLFIISLLSLSFPTIGDGFLLFPNDFDSNLIHVTGPRIIVERGYFFSPNWLRGLWLPQLTMYLYTFLLTFSSQMFLKTLNVVCFSQIALLFARTASSATEKVVALALFLILTTLPEFRQYVVQTNLDTIFAFFTVSAFFLLLKCIKNPTANYLLLLSFVCGLSGGTKHFGLMYSAPVMAVAILMYLTNGWEARNAARRITMVTVAGAILTATFCCFYLHNFLSGNALLFPFIGTKVNNYGWDDIDLKQMIESTIPHWGHSKTLSGYLLLPFHLITYPQKYQFYLFKTWADFGMSVSVGLLYLITAASLALRPFRRAEVTLPCLVLCADVFLWYRGSQVIRYLYPILISFLLLAAWLLHMAVRRLCRSGISQRTTIGLSLTLAAVVSTSWIVPPKTPLPQTDREIQDWLATYRGSKIEALRWLSENAPHGAGILNLAGHGEIAQFPRLVLCGDWFGRCRYAKFLSGYIQFRPWPELQEALRANGLTFIVVNWNSFAPHSKPPISPDDWASAIPSSSRNCLEHIYNDGVSTDVYKVKEACLL